MEKLKKYKNVFEEDSSLSSNIEKEITNYVSKLRFEFADNADLVVLTLQSILRELASKALLKSRDSFGSLDRQAYTKAFKKYWK